jgi:hypothetical protein
MPPKTSDEQRSILTSIESTARDLAALIDQLGDEADSEVQEAKAAVLGLRDRAGELAKNG